MMMFEPSSLYGLSTMNTTGPTLADKIIIDVIDKGKIVALP